MQESCRFVQETCQDVNDMYSYVYCTVLSGSASLGLGGLSPPPPIKYDKVKQGRNQGETGKTFPPKPGKFAKNGKQTRPQPAVKVSLDSKRKYKFSLIFKILLKFSKSSKIFLQTFKSFNKFSKICSNFYKFFSKHSYICCYLFKCKNIVTKNIENY